MLNKKLVGIYNISSGKKINLLDILNFLNSKYKKKIIIKYNSNKTILYGSNSKLIKKGWKLNNFNFLKSFEKNY